MTSKIDARNWQEYLIRRIDPEVSFDSLMQFPRYFEIETVNACNAHCPMCTIADWTRNAPTMKDSLFEKIAYEICENRRFVKRVNLYRDGEPLLDKKLPQRIARLKDGKIKEVAISTNGSLMNQSRAKDILDADIDLVLFSIDSLKKETFEELRAGLIFEEVIKNTRDFINMRDNMNSDTKVWIRMIRQDLNLDEWPEYEKYWRNILRETDRVNYKNLHNWGNQLKNFNAGSVSFEPNFPCVALWSLFVVFADGNIPLCNVDFNQKFPNGNVKNSSISDLWQSRIMATRRQLHLRGKKAEISICDNCNAWDEAPDITNISEAYTEGTSILAT
jgi:radical SAM protein with 4Fe4S-binding SPASM domain